MDFVIQATTNVYAKAYLPESEYGHTLIVYTFRDFDGDVHTRSDSCHQMDLTFFALPYVVWYEVQGLTNSERICANCQYDQTR